MIDFIDDSGALESEDQGRLFSIVSRSLRVSNEHQFFSWAQCEVQYLIPHEILICGLWVGSDPRPKLYNFSSTRYFQDEEFVAVCDPENGLIKPMMQRAQKSGRGCIVSKEVAIGDYDEAWVDLLESHELKNVVANGLHGPDGRLKSYFCFARVSGTLCARTLYLLEVLMPTLEATLGRIVARRNIQPEPARMEVAALGAREIQVINLIKVGKTNQVIAEELFISPLTVKNHVQNILKKLQVRTRGHAVAKAIDLGLLK
ncbi:MAG TPA: XrtB/PEP-CTERM-associated transcriptional regulator EpsA [Gallionella sp.]|nr:XrtB/PEP-CTERM-associated transcriptional regulator EpsA [Gallionella sp.]